MVPSARIELAWIPPFDFKSNAYTSSANWANLEVPTGIEPVYAVLQTAA